MVCRRVSVLSMRFLKPINAGIVLNKTIWWVSVLSMRFFEFEKNLTTANDEEAFPFSL